MSTGKNDDVIENQTTENRDMNREYIAGIDVMPKPKNPDNLQGNRVVNNNPKPGDEPVKATFYQKYLTRKYVLGALGALAILLVALCFIFTGSPKKVAEDYINAIAAADYGKAYQYLYVKEQPTLGSSAYLQFVEFSRSSKEDNIYKISQNEIKSIDLSEGKEIDGVLSFDASVVVKTQNGEEKHKYMLYLEKEKTGPFGLFTGYRIAGNGIYTVPKINCFPGTEQISIDNVKLIDENKKLTLNKPIFYGWHEVECKGKFYDSFNERIAFTKEAGMLKLDGKKIKLNSTCLEALAVASKEFTTIFLPATLTANGYKQCKAVPDEKTIEEMYSSFRDGFKQVGVSSINIKDGQVVSAFAGEDGNIHCQYQYLGEYEQNGEGAKECAGIISFEYIYENEQLVVAKINDYDIHLKD